MKWYVIIKESKSDRNFVDTLTEPDNHWPSIKIKMHKLKKENKDQDKTFRIISTSY